MAPAKLSPSAVKLIHKAVDSLFDRIKSHVIGDRPQQKRLYIAYRPELTLKGIFDAASQEEGVVPHADVFKTLAKISESYMDATREKMKAKLTQKLTSFLHDASVKGIDTNLKIALGGHIEEVGSEITKDVRRILETESTIIRNTSIMDGIIRANAMAGIDDPTVFFVTVRDQHRCDECTRLHVQPDKITPRVWKMSELGSGYHKRGDPEPKVGGLHPHCRCVLTTLMPGYGFDGAGRVTYKSPGYDEYAVQRGTS